MWTMGILLVTDTLDEHASLTNLFGNGNPLIWGWLGWCVVLLCIALEGYQYIKFIRSKSEFKHTIAACVSEKEKNRVKLDRIKLTYEKRKEIYEEKKRKLDKELKGILEKEFELGAKLLNKPFFMKGKTVVKDIEKFTRDKKDLKKEVSDLEKQLGVETKKYLSYCDKLQKEVEKCEEQIEEAECNLEEKKNNFMKKKKKRKVVWRIVFLIVLTDGNNMLVTAQELKDTLVESLGSSKESQVNEPEREETASEDVALVNEEKNNETSSDIENNLREHMDYNFVLEDEQLHKVIDGDIEDIILLTGYPKNVTGYEQFLIDCREGKLIEILPGENSDSELGLNKLLNQIAEDMEKPFLKKIDKGRTIRTQIEWEQSAPKSMELENIIDKRRQVLGMEDSIPIRRTIYFRLANDYQRLGLECLIQGKDDTQTYYYYGMSIYCCYCALGYERSGEKSYSDEAILNYVKARYKDIIENVKMENLAEEVNMAEQIYLILNQ